MLPTQAERPTHCMSSTQPEALMMFLQLLRKEASALEVTLQASI